MNDSVYHLTIYWTPLGLSCRPAMIKRFGFPRYISINGETSCDIHVDDMESLHKAQDMGYIQIRKMDKKYERREKE